MLVSVETENVFDASAVEEFCGGGQLFGFDVFDDHRGSPNDTILGKLNDQPLFDP